MTRVCPSINLSVHGGGYPYPIMLCNISQNAMGQTPGGGTLPGGQGGTLPGPAGGVPCRGGTLPDPAGGYPARSSREGTLPGPAGGVPCWGGTLPGPAGGGTLPRGVPWSGTHPPPPGQVRMGGSTPPPGQVRMEGGYPGRTTEGVLNTRQAVCLLRSRMRTFLFDLFPIFKNNVNCNLRHVDSISKH